MALHMTRTMAEFAGLAPNDKLNYKLEGEQYVLDLAALDNGLTTLRSAKQHEVQGRADDAALHQAALAATGVERDELLARIKAEADARLPLEDQVRNAQAATAEATTLGQTQLDALRLDIGNRALDSAAKTLAGEIYTAGDALSHMVKTRLAVELDDQHQPVISVLDTAGVKTSLTLAELTTELRGIKDHASMIKAVNSSGGGADGANGGGAAVDLSKMTNITDLTAYGIKNPTQQKAVEAQISKLNSAPVPTRPLR